MRSREQPEMSHLLESPQNYQVHQISSQKASSTFAIRQFFQEGNLIPPFPDFRTQNPLPPVNHASAKLNGQQAPFHALLNNLTHHLTSTPIFGRSPQIPYLHSLLRSYKSNPSHWSKYAHANPEKQYTRNLVCEVPGVFNLLLLVWTPGKKSPVHDHADAHCLMKVCCCYFRWMGES